MKCHQCSKEAVLYTYATFSYHYCRSCKVEAVQLPDKPNVVHVTPDERLYSAMLRYQTLWSVAFVNFTRDTLVNYVSRANSREVVTMNVSGCANYVEYSIDKVDEILEISEETDIQLGLDKIFASKGVANATNVVNPNTP